MRHLVTFYEYHGQKKKIEKDLTNVEDATTINVNFKDGYTLSNPDIILLRSDVDDVKNCNYAHIPNLGRYYFISPQKDFEKGGFVILHLHVDVLSSFKSAIKSAELLIERTSKSSWKSPYLNDTGLFPTAKRDLIIKTFGSDIITPSNQIVLHTSGVGEVANSE